MALISIITDKRLKYPQPDEYFSPSTAYPEYELGHLSQSTNDVYDAVRNVILQAGLDRNHYGTPAWNPFGRWLKRGQKVFVLCNFVFQRRASESESQFYSKCTHAAVVRPIVDYLLKAVGPEGRVFFGNAPLQGCCWDDVLRDTHAEQLDEFFKARGLPVASRDLRLFVAERGGLSAPRNVVRRDESDGVNIELGSNSLLSEFDDVPSDFRVLDYSPDRITNYQRPGNHSYILNRQILESDLIFSIPKLKTHEKVGITCVLKGCVGAIGHKDCLAHHRQGAPKGRGDEYPSDPLHLLYALSRIHDTVNRLPIETRFGRYARVADRALRKIAKFVSPGMGGAWWGNDTAWRMTLDIARAIRFADTEGTLQHTEQRRHLALVDGIIGGQGEGPLNSLPAPAGTLIFGDHPPLIDAICAKTMGYDFRSIPLIREAFDLAKLPLSDPFRETIDTSEILLNGAKIDFGSIPSSVGFFEPPKGWSKHLRQPHPTKQLIAA